MPKAVNRKKVGDIEENIAKKAYKESIEKDKAEIENQQEATQYQLDNYPFSEHINNFQNNVKQLSNHPARKWLIGLLVASILFFIIALGFAFKDTIFWASLEGFIIDPTGKPVATAQIQYGSTQTFSDVNGFYRFSNIPVSEKISINASRFKPFEQNLILSNWQQQQKDFTLEYINFSTAYGELITPDSKPLQDLQMYVNDNEVDLTDKIFRLGPLEVGKHKLRFSSPTYQTVELNLDLLPGENDLGKINLVAAENIQLQLLDWSTGEPLKSGQVKLGDASFISDDAGLVTIPNWEANQNQTVQISLDGFLTIDLVIDSKELKQYMVSNGKIAYLSDRNGIDNIYTSNIDGSGEQALTDFKTGSIGDLKIVDNEIWFQSDFENIKNTAGNTVIQIYKLAITGGDVIRVTNLTGSSYSDTINEVYTVDMTSKSLIRSQTQQDPMGPFVSKLWVSNLDGQQENLIRNRSFDYPSLESVTETVISPNGQKLAYILNGVENRDSYDENVPATTKILTVNRDGSEVLFPVEETGTRYSLGYYEPFGFSSDNAYFVYFQRKNDEMSVVIYDFLTKQNTAIKSNEIFDYAISSDSKYLYYLTRSDDKSNLFRVSFESKQPELLYSSQVPIESIELTSNGVLYLVLQNQGSHILRGKELVKVNISSTFYMWRNQRSNYGY